MERTAPAVLSGSRPAPPQAATRSACGPHQFLCAGLTVLLLLFDAHYHHDARAGVTSDELLFSSRGILLVPFVISLPGRSCFNSPGVRHLLRRFNFSGGDVS